MIKEYHYPAMSARPLNIFEKMNLSVVRDGVIYCTPEGSLLNADMMRDKILSESKFLGHPIRETR